MTEKTITSLELVREAHKQFKQLSIETKLVKYGETEDYYTGMVAVVTTEWGSYSGWAMGDVDQIDDLEEKALHKALLRTGIDLSETSQTKPSAPRQPEMAPSVFQAQDTSEPSTIAESSAESAPHELCAQCGRTVSDYYAGAAVMSARELVEKSQERYGMTLCAECLVTHAARQRRRKKTKTENEDI